MLPELRKKIYLQDSSPGLKTNRTNTTILSVKI